MLIYAQKKKKTKTQNMKICWILCNLMYKTLLNNPRTIPVLILNES